MLDDAADLYQKLIMERARTPRHAGAPAAFDAEAEGDNPMCGDRVHLWIRRGGDGRIAELRHATRGCAICQASADLLGDAAIGRNRAEIEALREDFEAMVHSGAVPARAVFQELQALAGVHEYRSRIRCATLPWQALTKALAQTGVLAETGEV
jgi:nitrogen fixation NifU-like protein